MEGRQRRVVTAMARIRLGRRGWWALGTAAGLGSLALAGWLLPDAGLRWGLIRTLRDYGMVEVSVADSALSLFDGHLVVRDVVARPPLGSALGIGDFALNFRWGPLFRRQVVIDRLALTGVTIDIQREAGSDVIVINGLPLAAGEPPPPAGQPAPAPSPARAAKTPGWGVDLTELDLTDSRLHLASGPLVADIAIKHLHVANLHSRKPDLPVSFSLDGSLNGAPVTLSGTVLPFAAEPAFTLDASASGLDLAAIAAGLAEIGLTEARGAADLAVTASGRLGADGAHVEGQGRLDIARAALAQPVTFRADRFALALGHLTWAGGQLDLDGSAEAAGLTIDLGGGTALAASKARLETPAARLVGRHLTAQGSLDTEGFAVKGSPPALTAARGHWAGDLESDRGAPFRIGGTVTLDEAKLADRAYSGQAGRVSLTGRLLTTPAGAPFPLRSDGALEAGLDRLHLTAGDISATVGQTRLSARLEPAPARSALPLTLAGPSRLELRDGRLTAGEVAASLGHGEVTAELAPVPAGAAVPVTARGKIAAERLAIGPARGHEEWLAVERIAGDELALTRDGHAGAARIRAEGLAALRRTGGNAYPWRIEARALRLDRPSHDGRTTRAEEARLDDLTLRLTRTGEGLLGFSAATAATGTDDGRPQPPPRLALGRVVVAGASRLTFHDRTLPEPLRLEVSPIDLTIERLDGTHPDHDSPFRLATAIGSASIAASGTLRPFASPPGGRIDSRISALELPPFSPYVADALGLQLRTGHFDGTLRGEAKSGALDAGLDLTLSNLAIAAPDPHAPLLQRTGLPIETVLDLLRDGEGRIKLSIPVKGRLDSPDFDFSDAVNQAIGGALSSAVMTTLKVAFPLTALISLIGEDSDGGRLTVAPLTFAPGDASLGDEQRALLDRAATLLQGRAGLHLTLCGKATLAEGPVVAARRRADDHPVLSRLQRLIGAEPPPPGELTAEDRAALQALADRRSAAAKAYLAEKAGIPPERLYSCRGEIEEGNDKAPRVDLLL
ncbi:DUF748 domain-containing protein [Phaeospirillum tilakii]